MKKQSLERILAENMLRFGTKNLGDTISTVKRLVEQLGAGDGVEGVIIPADILGLIGKVGPTCTAYKNGVAQLKKMNIPVICNGSIIDALIWAAFKGNAARLGSGKIFKQLGMTTKFNEKLKSILDGLYSDSFQFVDVETVSFNPYPADPTLVATIGEVTPAMGISGAEQAGSSYNDLLTYLNTYNLMNAVATVWTKQGVQQYLFNGRPADKDKNGFLNLDASRALVVYGDICFYATARSGIAKAGKTISTSTFKPIPGDMQTVPIAPDTFPKMGVVVADAGWTKITSQLEGFQSDPKFGGAGWKITGITVNTAASLGEKVMSANVATFSQQTGATLQDLEKAGITDANVKDPIGLAAGAAKAGRSGQDFLAITRANNIKQKLEVAFPGIRVTTVPMLAVGAATGRYGSVDFTVLGPDREISIPAEMASTGKVVGTENLEKVFNCYRVDSNYPLEAMFYYADDYEKGAATQ